MTMLDCAIRFYGEMLEFLFYEEYRQNDFDAPDRQEFLEHKHTCITELLDNIYCCDSEAHKIREILKEVKKITKDYESLSKTETHWNWN